MSSASRSTSLARRGARRRPRKRARSETDATARTNCGSASHSVTPMPVREASTLVMVPLQGKQSCATQRGSKAKARRHSRRTEAQTRAGWLK